MNHVSNLSLIKELITYYVLYLYVIYYFDFINFIIYVKYYFNKLDFYDILNKSNFVISNFVCYLFMFVF